MAQLLIIMKVISLKWTLPFGAGKSSRACSCPGGWNPPLFLQRKPRRRASRTWTECLGPVVRIKLNSVRSVCLSPWERYRQTLEYFKCSPGHWLLREKWRTRWCQLSCFRKGLAKQQEELSHVWKPHSSSCKEVQHSWRGQASTGAVSGELGQHKLQQKT